MGRGWLLSSLLHMSLAAVLWLGLPSWGRPLPAIESGITVELVSEAELTPPEPAVAALAPEPEREAARPAPTPPPEPERVLEPEPPAPEPVVAPEPPPEPVVEPAPEPPPPPEPEVARVEPEPPAPEPESQPEPELQPEPKPEPVLATPERSPPQPEPEPQPEQQAALQPQPPPEVVPSRPEPPATLPTPQTKPTPPAPKPEPEPAKAEPEPAQSEPPKEDDDAWLRGIEQEMQRQAEIERAGTGHANEGRGQARTTVADARLAASELTALRRALQSEIEGCRRLLGINRPDVVTLSIKVRPDRTATATPVDEERINRDPTLRAMADNAIRAVETCSPLKSVVGYPYPGWREFPMNFHPPW